LAGARFAGGHGRRRKTRAGAAHGIRDKGGGLRRGVGVDGARKRRRDFRRPVAAHTYAARSSGRAGIEASTADNVPRQGGRGGGGERGGGGALMFTGVARNDLFGRAEFYIEKTLRGAKPADLPVEQASKYQLVINLKTAKALGLTVPPSLLALADEVIE